LGALLARVFAGSGFAIIATLAAGVAAAVLLRALLDHARTVIAKRHPVFQGLVVPLTHRICRYTTMHYEVSIANT